MKLVLYIRHRGGILFPMYSSFPDGWSGAGLLLMRVAVGTLLTVQGAAYVLDASNQRYRVWLLALLAVSSGILLLIGCLTRLAALVAALVCGSGVFSWLPAPHLDLLAARLPSILIAVIAAAVICLGPGAFSLDALIFGRREVVIPRNRHDYEL